MRQILRGQFVQVLFALDSVVLEHPDLAIARPDGHGDGQRRRQIVDPGQLFQRLPAALAVQLVSLVQPVLPHRCGRVLAALVLLGGRDVVAVVVVVVVHYAGIVHGGLLVAVVAGLSGLQHVPRGQSVQHDVVRGWTWQCWQRRMLLLLLLLWLLLLILLLMLLGLIVGLSLLLSFGCDVLLVLLSEHGFEG